MALICLANFSILKQVSISEYCASIVIHRNIFFKNRGYRSGTLISVLLHHNGLGLEHE